MIDRIKIIANYLPQYHEIPENNKWWGKGFTDWIAVRNANKLFENHDQPKVPLDNNYYDLTDVDTLRWQAKLARDHGIYGFGIYHYWFSSKQQLLQKPAELILENKDIDINFMFIWDNYTWKRTWSKLSNANVWAPSFDNKSKNSNEEKNVEQDNGILAELIYGNEEDWKIHFNYLLKFFKDDRYIKIDNKPVFSFYQTRNNFPVIEQMTEYWNKLAIENGFNGVMCLTKDILYPVGLKNRMKYSPFQMTTPFIFLKYKLKTNYYKRKNKVAKWKYDRVWKDILFEAKVSSKNTFLCGFVNYDDSPRRGNKARIITGGTPEKFEKYFAKLVKISKKQNKEYVFLMAWNEWGEGSYLEPDSNTKYKYLDVVKKIVEK